MPVQVISRSVASETLMARENCQCWIQARISGVVLSELRGKGGPMGFGCGGLGMRDQGRVAIVCLSWVVVKRLLWC